MQGLDVLQPRFLRWLGKLGGAADCMLMQHPLLQSAAQSKAVALSGFTDGAWRGMEDILGLSLSFEGSSEAVIVWLDRLMPLVSLSGLPCASVRRNPCAVPRHPAALFQDQNQISYPAVLGHT